MRMLRAAVSACVLFALSPALALGNAAPPDEPDFDTIEGRAQALVPLDELIPPSAQAELDAKRDQYARDLERYLKEGARAALVDMRHRDTPVKKQFGGTCTAFGLLASMENAMGGTLELSPKHFWSQYATYSSARAVRAATENRGTVEMKWWPSRNRNPYKGYKDQPWYKLAKHQALEGDVARAVESVAQGHPVFIAFSTPRDLLVNKPVRVDPESTQYKRSGHAVAIVGYELDPATPGGGSFLLKNSWGDKAGDRGYHWYPFVLCTKKRMYCLFWSVEGVSRDNGPGTPET
jgi:C1A family cysteine protease